MLAYKAWYQSLLKVYPPSIIYYPIWGNKTMNIPFINRLYSNGLIFLGDIIDEDGNFLSKMDLEIRFNCNIMITTNSIPREWKELLRENTKDYNLQQPPMLSYLYKCKKGTKYIRHIWSEQQSKKIPIGQTKWDIKLTHDNALLL